MTPVTELLLKYMNSHPELFENGSGALPERAYDFLDVILRDQPDDFGIRPYLPEEERNLIRDKLRELRLDGLHKQLMRHITNDDMRSKSEYGKEDKVKFRRPQVGVLLSGNETGTEVYQKHATLMHNALTENLKQQAAIMQAEVKAKVEK